MKKRKYIFVVGGVMSGVGKGVATSSIAKILQARGLGVTAIKIDPYINIDAGTMNPTEHGEVFVLEDGDETDQDMGNYERFLNVNLSRDNYMTTGRVYQAVIERERNLGYGGRNVEVVPDIPLEVIDRIEKAAEKAKADVTIIEVGGTVGEYQNILFLEAARMMRSKYPDGVAIVLVSYLPIPSKVGEMKTKPTQYAARTLNSAGLQADIIIGRAEMPLDQKRKQKISLICNIREEDVISAPDIESIYEAPLNFEKDHLSDILLAKLKLKPRGTDLQEWRSFVSKVKRSTLPVRIAIIGKYFSSGDFILSDVYISVIEAVKHAAYAVGRKPEITWLSSEEFEGSPAKLKELNKYDGVLIPGGFGSRGVEGKIKVIQYVREHKIPYFGLCYGMQLAVIEYARNVLGIKDATTEEINRGGKNRIIGVMLDQKEKLAEQKYGGTMRLGAYPAILKAGTVARTAYKKAEISERHRHRYEVNPEYIAKLEEGGLVFSGTSPDMRLMEIAELPTKVHPFFLGTQFHPEFKSSPLAPHPLFVEFVKTAVRGGSKKSK